MLLLRQRNEAPGQTFSGSRQGLGNLRGVTRKGSVFLQVGDPGQVPHISHSQRAHWGSGFTSASVGLRIEESPHTGIGRAAYRHIVGLHVRPSP